MTDLDNPLPHVCTCPDGGTATLDDDLCCDCGKRLTWRDVLDTAGPGDAMTPYQRGHRDSLLNLAALLDATAKRNEQVAEKFGHPDKGTTADQAQRTYDSLANAYANAADLARKQAERMPEDPEVDGE